MNTLLAALDMGANFVASSKELIDAASARWSEQRFPQVPGETDFIPLP